MMIFDAYDGRGKEDLRFFLEIRVRCPDAGKFLHVVEADGAISMAECGSSRWWALQLGELEETPTYILQYTLGCLVQPILRELIFARICVPSPSKETPYCMSATRRC